MKKSEFRGKSNGIYFTVHPPTVGQLTGWHDKEGIEIWEGDIVQVNNPYKNRSHTGEVFFIDGRFKLNGLFFSHLDSPDDFGECLEYSKVIGNIHDDPELSKQ